MINTAQTNPFFRLAFAERKATEIDEYPIVFDPAFTVKDPQNNEVELYAPYLNSVKDVVSQDLGVDIEFDEQNLLINKNKNTKSTQNYNYFKNLVENEAKRVPNWEKSIPSKARDGMVAFWADNFYALNNSIKEALPKDDNNNYSISQDALNQIVEIENNYMSYVGNQLIKSTAQEQVNMFNKNSFGFAQSAVNAIENYARAGRAIATSPYLGAEDSEFGKWAQSGVDNMSAFSQQFEPPSGLSAMSITDIAQSDYDSYLQKLSDMAVATIGHGINSLPQNLPSTVATILATQTGPLGTAGKVMLGPALAGGGLAEIGGMTKEMEAEFRKLRDEARAVKPLISTEKFNNTFMTASGKTYDDLEDDEIIAMADDVGRQYGLIATMIELAEFGIIGKAAGVANQVSKGIKKDPSALKKIVAKYYGKFGGAFVGEAGEEMAQETVSEYFKMQNLPDHQYDWRQVIQSGVIGGVHGSGLQLFASAISGARNRFTNNVGSDVIAQIDQYKKTDGGENVTQNFGQLNKIPDDGGYQVRGGYDNALIIGSIVQPSSYIEQVANTWNVSQDEVEARWRVLKLDPKVDTSLNRAKLLSKTFPNIEEVFPATAQENYTWPGPKKEEIREPGAEISDFEQAMMDLENFEPDNDFDPDVSLGLDMNAGNIDLIEKEMLLMETDLEMQELQVTDDPSVISPQEKTKRLDELQKQKSALQQEIRKGATGLQQERQKKVKTKQAAKAKEQKVEPKKPEIPKVSVKAQEEKNKKALQQQIRKPIDTDNNLEKRRNRSLSLMDENAEETFGGYSFDEKSKKWIGYYEGPNKTIDEEIEFTADSEKELIKKINSAYNKEAQKDNVQSFTNLSQPQVEVFEEKGGEVSNAVNINLNDLMSQLPEGTSLLEQNKQSMKDEESKQVDTSDIAKTAKNTTGKINSALKDPGLDSDLKMSQKEGEVPKIVAKAGKAKRKIDAHFETLWTKTKRKHGYTEGQFEAWSDAMGKVMEKMPYTENFDMWVDERKNKGFFKRKLATILRGRGDTFTDGLMQPLIDEIPYIVEKEAESYQPWGEAEEMALKVSDFSKISNSFFVKYQFRNLTSDKVKKINEEALRLIRSNHPDPYNEFIKNISARGVLVTDQGLTVAELINRSDRASEAFRKYYIMLHPENTGTIHRGLNGQEVNYETRMNKRDSTSMRSTKNAFFYFRATDTKRLAHNKNPKPTVATRRMITRHNPLKFRFSSLSTKDIVIFKNGQHNYGFLKARQILRLYKDQLRRNNLVPLSTRGEDGQLIMISRPKYALDVARDKTKTKQYIAENFKELDELGVKVGNEEKILRHFQDLTGAESLLPADKAVLDHAFNGNYTEFKSHWIARNDALKMIFGPEYIFLKGETLAKRIKIPFTPVFTSNDLGPRRKMYFDAKGAKIEYYEEGSSTPIKSVEQTQIIDGESQYIGDGEMLVSEVVFSEQYPKAFGNTKEAKRLKTIHYTNENGNVDASKMDEKTLFLKRGQNAKLVDKNGNEIAVFVRDRNNNVNIYEPGNIREGQEIHYLSSNDETKVRTGDYKQDNVVHTLPANSVGVIRYTHDRIKKVGMLSTQISYYVKDQQFQNAIMTHYRNDMSSRFSPTRMARYLIEQGKSAGNINDLIKQFDSQYIDVVPTNVTRLAELGSGFHPSGLTYIREVAKNKMLKPIADFRTDGTYLDFRSDRQGELSRSEVILPYNEEDAKFVLDQLGKTRKDYDSFNDMVDAINDWLSSNKHHVIIARVPLVDESAYGLYSIKELRLGIGDTFIMHPLEVKERHNADHDNDHGHISRLDDTAYELFKPHIKNSKGLNMDRFARKKVEALRSSSLGDSLPLAEVMTYGAMAIGEIVNTTRMASLVDQMFGDTGFITFTLDGQEVAIKPRSMDEMVDMPNMKLKSGGHLKGKWSRVLSFHTQAALDHPKLLLLNEWGYNSQELRRYMFKDPQNPSAPIDERIYNTLNRVFLDPILRINNMVDNMENYGVSLKFNDVFAFSKTYTNFMQNREATIQGFYDELIKDNIDNDKFFEKHALIGNIRIPADEKPVALQEMVTSMFQNILDSTGIHPDYFYNTPDIATQFIHDKITKKMFSELSEGGLIETPEDVTRSDMMRMLNKGAKYAQTMSYNFYSMINKIENVGTPQEPAFIDMVSPKSFDHNPDFIKFHETFSKKFNTLNEFEQKIATLQFLAGTVINNTATGKQQLRKTLRVMPPVSRSIEESSLHPEIIQDYFKRFNKEYVKHRQDNEFKNQIGKKKPLNGLAELKKRFC